MLEIKTKFGVVKIFNDEVDEVSLSQVHLLANSVLAMNANIRFMPDIHAGVGCVIGTTMLIGDKICPNLVGVDVGCGVTLIKTDIDFSSCLPALDKVIRKSIPCGTGVHKGESFFELLETLRCWPHLDKQTKDLARRALGTLGGGNHFIEAYDDGWIAVHSGSRNIGYRVADHYQKVARRSIDSLRHQQIHSDLDNVPSRQRADFLKTRKEMYSIDDSLAYLMGSGFDDYIHDMKILNLFAQTNRATMLGVIVEAFGGKILETINSTHNYIDTANMILRKGAISAREGEKLVIPLNMRDGLLVCIGKGNPDWNFSAPHGAGRLYSRTRALELFTVEEYKESMKGIYSSCIGKGTLDEAPFAYKDYRDIMSYIEPTVEIVERLLPIYNFKAS